MSTPAERWKARRPVVPAATNNNPLLAALCNAVADAKRAGYTGKAMHDSLGRFLHEQVTNGNIDLKTVQQVLEHAKEVKP